MEVACVHVDLVTLAINVKCPVIKADGVHSVLNDVPVLMELMIRAIMKTESVNVNQVGEDIIVIFHVCPDSLEISANQNAPVPIQVLVITSQASAVVHPVEPVTDVSPFVHRVATGKIVSAIVLVMAKIKSAHQKVVIVHVPAVGPGPSVTKNALPVDGVPVVSTFVNVKTVTPSLVLVHVHRVSLAPSVNNPAR